MRTDEDLKAAFSTLADRAPTPHDADITIPADERPVRRRTRGPVLLAAAAAGVIVIAVPTVIAAIDSTNNATTPPPVASSADAAKLRLPFTVEIPGWTTTGRSLTADAASLSVTTAPELRCTVSVYRPGRFDTGRIAADRDPVTVNGKDGYYATLRYDTPKPKGPQGAPAVIWEYAPDSWAFALCVGSTGKPPADDRSLGQRAAEATSFTPQALPVPYELGYVPAGFKTSELQVSSTDLGTYVKVAGGSGMVRIMAGKTGAEGEDVPDEVDVTPVVINGRQAWFFDEPQSGTESLHLQFPGYYVELQLNRSGQAARAELHKMATRLRPADDLLDVSTWPSAETALPPRAG
jgi:hypothetical protein